MKKVILFSILVAISSSGCARIIKNLDSPAWSPPTEFQKAHPLPPLEITPELVKKPSSLQPKATKNP